MENLKLICQIVDDFVSCGSSSDVDSSQKFWNMLNKDASTAQRFAECLIYKYIGLSCGFGNRPLYPSLTQIKNVCAPNDSKNGSTSSPAPTKSKLKNSESILNDGKSSPKWKFHVKRRRSEEKSRKDGNTESELKRKSSKNTYKAMQSLETNEYQDVNVSLIYHKDMENVLFSLNYLAKLGDLTKWDYTRLRDVFLVWNKARGWEQSPSDYESVVMKRFSVYPAANTNSEELSKRCLNDIFLSLSRPISGDEQLGMESKSVGESICYWAIRQKLLTKPEETVTVIKSLVNTAQKVFNEVDESRIIPLLHLLCETLIMSSHTPLELLQRCYSTFEKFYLWPLYVARPVKKVLDFIQLEMKSPGHFYRMIFLQDCDTVFPQPLFAKMPSSTTYAFIDSDAPQVDSIAQSLKKLQQSPSSISKIASDREKYRFMIRHIFEAVFGNACCDLVTLDQTLQALPDNVTKQKCFEALAIMEEASNKSSHRHAQDYLRSELEVYSETLGDLEEGQVYGSTDENSDTLSKASESHPYEQSSLDEKSSKSGSFSGSFQFSSKNSDRNARRNTYSLCSPDGKVGARKIHTVSSADRLANLIGHKVSTKAFSHEDISNILYELIRTEAKEYVQEKKLQAYKRKDTKLLSAEPEDFRDSGVMDDEDQYSNLKTSERKLSGRGSDIEPCDKDSFWKEFEEKGFKSRNEDLEKLMLAMSFDKRKSFIMEMKLQDAKDNVVDSTINATTNESFDVSLEISKIVSSSNPLGISKITQRRSSMPAVRDSVNDTECIEACELESVSTFVSHRRSRKSDKPLNRISRFVRQKKKSSKKGLSDGELNTLSSAESSSSILSDAASDSSKLRLRTTSETTLPKSSKKISNFASYSSPRKDKLRHTFGGEILPSPLNLSVRSLPSRERMSIIGNELFINENTLLMPRNDSSDGEKSFSTERSQATEQNISSSISSQAKAEFYLEVDEEEDARRRIDSGIGPDGVHDFLRRRTISSYSTHRTREDLGIGGVKLALKEAVKAGRRGRMSVSDVLEKRAISKKVLKLIFIGNDKTLGHLARAYYDLKKRLMSRAPLFQHIDMRLYFIPITSLRTEENDILKGLQEVGSDTRLGELLGTYDPWYHTVITLSMNNLIRVYPKILLPDGMKSSGNDEAYTSNSVTPPSDLIARALLNYCRFAMSRTDLSMFKVDMVTSSGGTSTDVFCCHLRIGHEAYQTAVKSGRYGKMGKLVDLANDSEPPAAYSTIECSSSNMEGGVIVKVELPECFYHTVSLTPMAILNHNFKGTDIMQMILIDNEKWQKSIRRTSNTKHTLKEMADFSGGIREICQMKMTVSKPLQGTFAMILDDSKIYTNVKSLAVAPCTYPGAETPKWRAQISSDRLKEQNLMKLPLHTYWPEKE